MRSEILRLKRGYRIGPQIFHSIPYRETKTPLIMYAGQE